MDSLTEHSKTLKVQRADLSLLHSSGLLHDYLNGNKQLLPFISDFPTWQGIENQIKRKSEEDSPRQLLSRVLKNQYTGHVTVDRVQANIEAIADKNCYCITTAHQTNLFGGPLYWIYKAISTIKLAAEVKTRNPKINCIPVFWLGSEDHDFDELNHIHLHGKRLDWLDNQGGAFGRYNTKSLSTVFAELKAVLGTSRLSQEVINVMETAYSQETMAEASRALLNELFGQHGLLVIDGDDKMLKKEMASIFETDLFENKSQQLIDPQVEALEKIYGRSQAMVRDINLFYLHDNGRERIVRRGSQFAVSTNVDSHDNQYWKNELTNNIERFSPNVMLRPLMQEKLLPNLAYVGGGGELSYWFQLKPLFDHHGVSFPILMRRDSAIFLSKKNGKRLEKLNLSISDFIGDVEEVKKTYVRNHSKEVLELANQLERINEVFSEIAELAESIDVTLAKPVEGEKKKLSNSIKKLEKKMLRAEKRNFGDDMQRIDHIRAQVYPNNSFQERYVNFMQLYALYGPEFLDQLLDGFDPMSNSIKVFVES